MRIRLFFVAALLIAFGSAVSRAQQSDTQQSPPVPDHVVHVAPTPAAEHSYRLVVTVRPVEGAKSEAHRYELVVNGNGAPATLSMESKVLSNSREEDIGTRITAHIREKATGPELTFSLNVRSLVPGDATAALIRSIDLSTAAIMPAGKTVALGSLEEPGTNRRIVVEASLDEMK
jgi:hypothetical protein